MNQGKVIRALILGLPIGLVVTGVFAMTFCVDISDPEMGRTRYVSKANITEDVLRELVKNFAVDIGARNLDKQSNLSKAAGHIKTLLGEFNTGYEIHTQRIVVDGKASGNIEVEIRGLDKPEEIVVVGAHYDTAPGTPGANDNATGVAALIALAQAFITQDGARTLRFVAFTNEEPPYFQTEDMGSVRYARRCKQRGEKIVAMLSLEGLGYFSDEEDSQNYPAEIAGRYPMIGNFIAVVGNVDSKPLVEKVAKHLGDGCRIVPVEHASLPAGIRGVGFSDHWSFWKEGYQAVMITDTALFRDPHYHTSQDTPDKVDFKRLHDVVAGLENTIWTLVNP